jgi:hypothetical protein
VTPALLEADRPRGGGDGRQSRLFDELRCDAPAHRPLGQGPEQKAERERSAHARGEPHPRSGGDGRTLEARLERIWEGLLAAGAAECPVCGDRLRWSESGGSCGGCGSALR